MEWKEAMRLQGIKDGGAADDSAAAALAILTWTVLDDHEDVLNATYAKRENGYLERREYTPGGER